MEGHGLQFGRLAQAAVEGWLPLAAFAGSAWLFYAASDLDAVSTAVAPQAASACSQQQVDAETAQRCLTLAKR